jgi:putative DNA primase/helicase
LGRWRRSRGTLVERYLAGRGLDLGDDIAGSILRWHPGGHKERPGSVGAMLGLFRCIDTDEPRAISRRYLDAEGRKIGKPLFLGPVAGAAIKLDADEEVLGGLHVGEGIETVLTGRQEEGLRPGWALGSKGAIAALPVMSGVDALTIMAEPGAEKEIHACAARWHAAGREVNINWSLVGSDINDALLARRKAEP